MDLVDVLPESLGDGIDLLGRHVRADAEADQRAERRNRLIVDLIRPVGVGRNHPLGPPWRSQ